MGEKDDRESLSPSPWFTLPDIYRHAWEYSGKCLDCQSESFLSVELESGQACKNP